MLGALDINLDARRTQRHDVREGDRLHRHRLPAGVLDDHRVMAGVRPGAAVERGHSGIRHDRHRLDLDGHPGGVLAEQGEVGLLRLVGDDTSGALFDRPDAETAYVRAKIDHKVARLDAQFAVGLAPISDHALVVGAGPDNHVVILSSIFQSMSAFSSPVLLFRPVETNGYSAARADRPASIAPLS